MAPQQFELEALSSSAEILNGYDLATDQWRFQRDSDFWKAVYHAHDLGRRGQGQRVAIIDSGCNLAIPRLGRRVDKVRKLVPGASDNDPQGHGTAVALLISEVAPDSIIDIYQVTADDGKPDESATIEAIREAARSSATVINISMGRREELHIGSDASHNPSEEGESGNSSHISEEHPCSLCGAASAAAESGKLVFAAVGNSLSHTYCPARAPNVVAVGFQRQERVVPAREKEIFSLVPVAHQAIDSDLMLLGALGVLGSSFACPLYAGVGALGLTQSELWQFITSYKQRVFPLMFHAQVDTVMGGVGRAPKDLIENIDRGYWKSLSSLPHSHCDLQSELRPDAPRSDPSTCPFCGIFADLQYINFGYWLYSTKHVRKAIDLLGATRALCPWSARPVAFEGSAYFALGSVGRAIENYELAIHMRPGYQPYVRRLRIPRRAACF